MTILDRLRSIDVAWYFFSPRADTDWVVERNGLALPMHTNVEWLIAALPREEAEQARTRLDQLGRACACGFGVAGAFATLALYATGVALWVDLTANIAWMLGAIGFALFVLGAGLGKTFGMMRVRSQRNQFLDELYSRVAALDSSSSRAPGATL